MSEQKEEDPGLKTLGVLAGVASYFAVRAVPALGYFAVFMVVSGALGWLVGAFTLPSRPRARATLAWFGLVVWILPVLGAFLSGAIWYGQEKDRPNPRQKYLAIACLVLALINGAVGTVQRLPK